MANSGADPRERRHLLRGFRGGKLEAEKNENDTRKLLIPHNVPLTSLGIATMLALGSMAPAGWNFAIRGGGVGFVYSQKETLPFAVL